MGNKMGTKEKGKDVSLLVVAILFKGNLVV